MRYLEGRDVARFRVSWSGRFLRYGPWLAEHPPLSRFDGPRVLVREIIGKTPRVVYAAYVDEQYVYNRSILHVRLKKYNEQAKIYAQALTGILNSPLASFVLRHRGRKTQRRLFPKLVNDDLKEFPLPIEFDEHARVIAEAAIVCALSPSESAERTLLERVCAAYHLDADAVSHAALFVPHP